MIAARALVAGAAHPAPLLGTIVAVVLCGGVPLWVIAESPNPIHPAWIASCMATVVAGARLSWVVGSRLRRPYEMATWLFFYLFLGVSPMAQLRTGVTPATTPNLEYDYAWTAGWIVLWAEIALITGSTLRRNADLRLDLRRPSRYPSQRRANLVSFVILAAALGYIAIIGPAALFTSRIARNEIAAMAINDEVLRLLYGALVTLGLLVVVLTQLQIRRERVLRGERGGVPMLLVSCTVTLLLIVNPFSSPRYIVGVVYLSLLAMYGAYTSVRRFRALTLATLAGFVVVFPLLDSFRYDRTAAIEFIDPIAALTSADFDGFSQIINTVQYVHELGITWGGQLLGVLLFWVPRSIWPQKPVDTGILLAEARGYGFTNLSAPLPAELYINGGWAIVIVGMVWFGLSVRRWDALNEGYLRLNGVPTVLGCIVPFYFLLLLRGSLLQAASNLAVIIVTWWFVSAGTRSKRTRKTGVRNDSVTT